jgi:hypothetical protein
MTETTPAAMTPEAWIQRCTNRLVELIITADDFLERADLERVAVELIEDPRYNRLEPEAAADLHRSDTR